MYPMMKEDGYNPQKSAALFAASGCIGPIIPPSIPMILFGVVANVSIVKLFLGGIVPGVLIGVALMIGWYLHTRKNKGIYTSEGKFRFKALFRATKDAFWALILPAIILGGIIFGIYTPTEAGVIAVVYAFVVGFFIYGELKVKHIPAILVNAAKGTAVVMFICGSATAAAYYITTAQVPEKLAGALLYFAGDSTIMLMLVINILLLLVGCVMDLTPALLIMAPMLMPIVTKFHIDPVYFGVVMVINLCIGLITPPVGNVLYVGCGISKISLTSLAKAIFPNIIIMVVVLMLVTYIPQLILFIPNHVGR
jgi:tripartite ATP-independent transporter DctM subunit